MTSIFQDASFAKSPFQLSVPSPSLHQGMFSTVVLYKRLCSSSFIYGQDIKQTHKGDCWIITFTSPSPYLLYADSVIYIFCQNICKVPALSLCIFTASVEGGRVVEVMHIVVLGQGIIVVTNGARISTSLVYLCGIHSLYIPRWRSGRSPEKEYL